MYIKILVFSDSKITDNLLHEKISARVFLGVKVNFIDFLKNCLRILRYF